MIPSLVKKYNKAIPRYTSYPPVPKWNGQLLSQKNWLRILNKDLNSIDNNSLSIYIHLPFCENLCTYCGCNKRITKRHNTEAPYIEALKNEWSIYRKSFSKRPKLKYLHLGGGTPTFFSPERLAEIVTYITADCELVENYSFSFEGHPNNTSFEHLKALKSVGFNRVSYGVQDFSLQVQKVIHRIQPVENVTQVVSDARKLGYDSINFDLVYGLPFQSIDSIKNTIQKVGEYKPERIALYSYAHVPWVSKSQRGYDESNLPAADDKLSFYLYAKEKLIALGYQQIGMDHFALPQDELSKARLNGTMSRNFMGYTVDNSHQMIGLGCSSISSSEHGFVQNEKQVEAYQESVKQGILPIIKGHLSNNHEVEISHVISQLICNGFFNFKNHTHLFDEAYPELIKFQKDKLLEINGLELIVTDLGMLFIRNICAAFDIYIENEKESKIKVFSQSI